jgi:hypothetical protein
LAIGFIAGVFMIVQFFVPHAVATQGYELLLDWARIIGAFALVLGIGSLFRTHWDKIRRRRSGYGYNAVTLLSFGLMVWAGLLYGTGEGSIGQRLTEVQDGATFEWLFNNVQVPLDATMFALLAFFIASAAYRTFRARNIEATLLLVTAVIVMLGRVPIGEMIYDRMPDVYEWIMQYPAVAGKRGILFGVALGSIATSLRIILGIERSHLGG